MWGLSGTIPFYACSPPPTPTHDCHSFTHHPSIYQLCKDLSRRPVLIFKSPGCWRTIFKACTLISTIQLDSVITLFPAEMTESPQKTQMNPSIVCCFNCDSNYAAIPFLYATLMHLLHQIHHTKEIITRMGVTKQRKEVQL